MKTINSKRNSPTKHRPVGHGLCEYCGHYGDDCTGEADDMAPLAEVKAFQKRERSKKSSVCAIKRAQPTPLSEALDCLSALRGCLGAWVEIQDDEDARKHDARALRVSAKILKKHGRAV